MVPDIADLAGGGIDGIVFVDGYVIRHVVACAVKGIVNKGGADHVQFPAVPVLISAVAVDIVCGEIQHPGDIGILLETVHIRVAVPVAQMHRIIADLVQIHQFSVHVVGHALRMGIHPLRHRCREQQGRREQA